MRVVSLLRREDQKERQGKEQFLSQGGEKNHSRRNGVAYITKESTKYRSSALREAVGLGACHS